MAHARTTLRQAAVTALTGLTTTGSRVRDTDAYPRGGDDLPDITVEILDEEVSAEAFDDCQMRDAVLMLVVRAKSISAGPSTIDTIDTETSVALYAAFEAGTLTGARAIQWRGFSLWSAR